MTINGIFVLSVILILTFSIGGLVRCRVMLGKAHFMSVLYPIINIASVGLFVLMTADYFQLSADVIETVTQGSIREHIAAWGLGHQQASEAIFGIVVLLAETAYFVGNNFVDWYLAWKRKRNAAKSAIIS